MIRAVDSLNEIVSLRIDLVGSKPAIWREVELPTSTTLKVLHDIVQATMSWFDQHLWEIRLGDQRYGQPDDGWGGTPVLDAKTVRLCDILVPEGTVLEYLYDFGDGWEPRLVFSAARQGEPGIDYPRYVAGERAAPPEDCGGLPGYYEILAVLADPGHPDHEEITEDFGDHDPALVSVEIIEFALRRIARQRNAAKATFREKG